MNTRKQKRKDFSLPTKFFIVMGVVGVMMLGYAGVRVLGDTTLNTTITSNSNLRSGLIGHWTFDGRDIDISTSTAEVKDRSGNESSGDWRNHATSTVAGRIGQSLEFDGVDDYIEVNNLNGQSYEEFSISAWYKSSDPSVSDDEYIYHHHDGSDWILFGPTDDTGNVDTLRIAYNIAGTEQKYYGTSDIVDQEWHHLLLNVSNSRVKLYVDGTAEKDTSNSYPGSDTIDDVLNIGDNPGDTEQVDGAVDDMRVYNRSLSTEEIKRLYELGESARIAKTLTANTDLDSNLAGHWTFDGPDIDLSQVAAEVRDRDSNNNHGDWKNHASTTVHGRLGQAIEFDGTDDYTTHGTPASLQIGNQKTLTAWIKFNSTGSGDDIISYFKSSSPWNGYAFGWNDNNVSNKLYLWHADDSNNQKEGVSWSPTTDEWYHVAVSFDSGTATFYVDGSQQGSSVSGFPSPATFGSVSPFRIGAATDDKKYFDGVIDDVRVYDKALSADDISRIYNLGATTRVNKTIKSTGTVSGLLGHWTFDGPDMFVNVGDVSGNNHDGKILGQTTTTTVPGMMGQALDFDGSNDGVEISSSNDFDFDHTSDFSGFLWFKKTGECNSTNTDGNEVFFSRFGTGHSDNTWWFGCHGQGFSSPDVLAMRVQDSSEDGDPVGTTTIDDGEWHHTGWTFDASTEKMVLYLDGAVEATSTLSTNFDLSSSNPLCLGSYDSSCSTFEYHGVLDDVRIFNRKLEASEVKRLYNLGR